MSSGKPASKPRNDVAIVATEQRAIVPASLDPKMSALAQSIDQTARAYALAIDQASGHMERAFHMAAGIVALKNAITEQAMQPIMALMNTANGFKTDRPNNRHPQPYDAHTVKECLITAMLRGLYPIGNEFNIIAGECFTALAGWKRKFEEIPGISDIDVVPGVPRPVDGANGLAVRVALSWKLNGVPDRLINEKGESGVAFLVGTGSADALIGKAKRRAYMMAYTKATGSICTETDPVEVVAIDTSTPAATTPSLPPPTSKSEQKANRLLLEQVQALLARLDVDEPAWAGRAEALGVPLSLEQHTPEQLRRTLDRLQAEQAQIRAEDDAERLAIQQG